MHRIFFICNFLIFLGGSLISSCPAKGQQAVEVGSNCSEKSRLPQSLLCADGLVIDCRSATNTREQLYCAASELQKADNELNRLYQRALKRLDRPNDEYADYKGARRALTESQRAWVKFKKSDCEVPGYLNLKGSSQSNEMIACELKHTKNRISALGAHSLHWLTATGCEHLDGWSLVMANEDGTTSFITLSESMGLSGYGPAKVWTTDVDGDGMPEFLIKAQYREGTRHVLLRLSESGGYHLTEIAASAYEGL